VPFVGFGGPVEDEERLLMGKDLLSPDDYDHHVSYYCLNNYIISVLCMPDKYIS
jgi:hypothetical protein